MYALTSAKIPPSFNVNDTGYKNWDYSSLIENATSVIYYDDPAVDPFVDSFPLTNLLEDNQTFSMYMRLTDSALYTLGRSTITL